MARVNVLLYIEMRHGGVALIGWRCSLYFCTFIVNDTNDESNDDLVVHVVFMRVLMTVCTNYLI